MRQPLWQSAASFAARLHDHAKRDDKETPFIAHPYRVALTLTLVFGLADEEAVAAAILHDTVENTDTSYDNIEEEFGKPVADMVVALTKNSLLSGKNRDDDYGRRLAQADWRVRLIKMADQFDNCCDAIAGVKDGLDNELAKAKAIIKLARPDMKIHRETRAAIDALEHLIKRPRLRRGRARQ
jgi:guanosine-3',5'-bis(diphosphate) 3'-pyrophosphohydrolase